MGSEATFWLPANAPESLLEATLDTEGTALVALHLTNCLVADPDKLARLVTRCEKLRSLMCVASGMKAADVLSLMLGSVRQLGRLELSMVYENVAAFKQVVEVTKLGDGELRDALATNLRFIYAEVLNGLNFDLLEAFLDRCPNVTNLHVHLVGGSLNGAVSRLTEILAKRPVMETFSFTSEVPPPQSLEPPARLEFSHCASVCANVLFRREPQTWNIARLDDLAASSREIHLSEPVVLVGVNALDLETKIHQAASLNNWSDVRTFCMVLLLQPLEEGCIPHSMASASCGPALLELFQKFKNLTELNMNSFHFDHDLDLTELLIPLQDLQALSLPLYGLRHYGALQRLALRCPNIEDLDVRSGIDGRSGACVCCVQPLNLIPSHTAELSVCRKDGRLTVSVQRMASLQFAATCTLAELRIYDHSEHPHQDFRRLGELLSGNDRLRVLVLKYTGLNIATHQFKGDIERLRRLRYLCLLSDTILVYLAEPIVRLLARGMPTVEAIHVHYLDFEHKERQVTWMCPIDDPEDLQADVAGASGQQQPLPMQRGKVHHGRPCVFCSTQTFIGLSKPHNRGRKTNL